MLFYLLLTISNKFSYNANRVNNPTPPGTGVWSLTGRSGKASPCKPFSSLEIPTSITTAVGL